jgi:hypothetical protein
MPRSRVAAAVLRVVIGVIIAVVLSVEGSAQQLCFAPPGAERPTAFSAAKGSGHVLVTFERIAE